jgi:hypothetical protein
MKDQGLNYKRQGCFEFKHKLKGWIIIHAKLRGLSAIFSRIYCILELFFN